MIAGFRNFLLERGNAIDLAIGVVIGAAFSNVVTSLVEDIIMPPIGLVLANIDFSSLLLNLSRESITSAAEAKAAGVPAIYIGLFLNAIIKFVVIAVVIYLVLQQLKYLKLAGLTPAPTPSETLLTEIRDLLKHQAEAQHASQNAAQSKPIPINAVLLPTSPPPDSGLGAQLGQKLHAVFVAVVRRVANRLVGGGR